MKVYGVKKRVRSFFMIFLDGLMGLLHLNRRRPMAFRVLFFLE